MQKFWKPENLIKDTATNPGGFVFTDTFQICQFSLGQSPLKSETAYQQ